MYQLGAQSWIGLSVTKNQTDILAASTWSYSTCGKITREERISDGREGCLMHPVVTAANPSFSSLTSPVSELSWGKNLSRNDWRKSYMRTAERISVRHAPPAHLMLPCKFPL